MGLHNRPSRAASDREVGSQACFPHLCPADWGRVRRRNRNTDIPRLKQVLPARRKGIPVLLALRRPSRSRARYCWSLPGPPVFIGATEARRLASRLGLILPRRSHFPHQSLLRRNRSVAAIACSLLENVLREAFGYTSEVCRS
jgi:hypothetical protein